MKQGKRKRQPQHGDDFSRGVLHCDLEWPYFFLDFLSLPRVAGAKPTRPFPFPKAFACPGDLQGGSLFGPSSTLSRPQVKRESNHEAVDRAPRHLTRLDDLPKRHNYPPPGIHPQRRPVSAAPEALGFLSSPSSRPGGKRVTDGHSHQPVPHPDAGSTRYHDSPAQHSHDRSIADAGNGRARDMASRRLYLRPHVSPATSLRRDGKLTACFFGDVGDVVVFRQASWRSGREVLESFWYSPPPPRRGRGDAGQANQGSVAEQDSSIDGVRLVAFPLRRQKMWRGANQWMWSNQAGCSGGRPVRKKTAKGLLRAGMEQKRWTPRTKMGQQQKGLLKKGGVEHRGSEMAIICCGRPRR